ncbi:hypothetical protein GCM10027347_16160 [Larkinella harenae]
MSAQRGVGVGVNQGSRKKQNRCSLGLLWNKGDPIIRAIYPKGWRGMEDCFVKAPGLRRPNKPAAKEQPGTDQDQA